VAELEQFKLPDVGEGLTEAEIVSWKVKPGDTVRVNEVLVEIETAKSLVELPSPFAGTVHALLVDEGSTVDVGTPIVAVRVGDGAGAPAGGAPAPTSAPAPAAAPAGTGSEEGAVQPGLIGGPAPGGRTSVLVGYGPRTTSATRRPRKETGSSAATASAATARQAVQTSMMTTPTPLREPAVEDADHAAPAHPVHGGAAPVAGARALAKPPVRKLAKELGVDLADLRPSGTDGTVTREDVERAAGRPAGTAAVAAGPDGRRETRVPVKGVRKLTASAMVASAFTAPHVTEWVSVDVTRSLELVERLKADPEFRDVKVGPLLMLAKAVLLAVRRHPGVNATWDETAQEIVVKHYVNLGIAADTPRGLVVPNVKDAHALTVAELARALTALTETARAGRTQPAEMSGGTITITNVGVFGVDGGTPIINPGESAILAFGAVRDMPWVHEGRLAVRKVAQLAVSFDHRLIDGALGSRFLADVARVMEDPATALLW
jgi:pyruvate dehydrogenase E2 component (dihydrolipoamide acetyltransferase)